MIPRPGAARLLTLLSGLLATIGVHAACVTVASNPDGAVLGHIDTPVDEPAFVVGYVHSVTRTPVVESYRIESGGIVQTEIRFEQHGPGLPTQADAGGSFERRDGQIVVTMARRFDVIVMRVHADQSPRLTVGGQEHDLAAFGDRALALRTSPDRCTND